MKRINNLGIYMLIIMMGLCSGVMIGCSTESASSISNSTQLSGSVK